MNSAFSRVFFTVSLSAGYGLLALLGLVGNAHGKASSTAFGVTSIATALAFISVGFLLSTFDKVQPQQSPSKRPSSWLLRQRIAALITYPIALAFGAVWSGLIDAPQLISLLGLVTAMMCAVTVFCTAMIYCSLETVAAWVSKFTVPVYLAFCLATGSSLLNSISFIFGRFQTNAGKFMAVLTVTAILAAIILKWFDWHKMRKSSADHSQTERLQIRVYLLLTLALFVTLLSLAQAWLTIVTAVLVFLAASIERWIFFSKPEQDETVI